MARNRPDLNPHPYGTLTQGSIFTCAFAEKYGGCKVHGLVITARCDIAQQKYPVLNYLPIVSLKDWLKRDGLEILIEDVRNDLLGKINSTLRQAKLSTELLRSINLGAIAETHFPQGEGSRTVQKRSERFHKLVNDINHLKELASLGDSHSLILWLQQNRTKRIEDLIGRLFKHQVSGYYFLERISLEKDSLGGFVALLREATSISRRISDRIGEGLEKTRYDELCKDSDRLNFGLCIPQDDIAMPIVVIGSPTVEHILQSFASLFGRIGVADPDECEMHEIIQSVSGAQLGGES